MPTAHCASDRSHPTRRKLVEVPSIPPRTMPERYERNSAAMVGQQLPCALRRAMCPASGTDAPHADLFSPLPLPHRASSLSSNRLCGPLSRLFALWLLRLHTAQRLAPRFRRCCYLLGYASRFRRRSRLADTDYQKVIYSQQENCQKVILCL